MKTHIIRGSLFNLTVREVLAQGLMLSIRTLDSPVHTKNDLAPLQPGKTPLRKIRVMEEVRGQQTAEGHQMEKDLQEEDLLLDLGVLPEG